MTDPSDIVQRLRVTHFLDGHEIGMTKQRAEAADVIASLRARLAEAQAALIKAVRERDSGTKWKRLMEEGDTSQKSTREWVADEAANGGRDEVRQ